MMELREELEKRDERPIAMEVSRARIYEVNLLFEKSKTRDLCYQIMIRITFGIA